MIKPQSISAMGTVNEPNRSIATGVHICVHGHFYQPPREHPSLDVVGRQPSAAPFHDWNERILYESYRPNAFARILNDRGEVVRIVNNYEHISFNIGPTLMSWLERHDLETYQRILEADRLSCISNNGHGNAIAQVYNHVILPLANHRDKVTQVRWGIADFQRRFGRDPKGMWLAETAVDNASLEVLASEGIQFVVLAPSQAALTRRFGLANGFDDWQEVGNGNIDPTRPYRCFIPMQPNGRNYVDIFFYDGPISADMGFDDILSSSEHFADRLTQAIRPWD
jgi:alpha-amylase/alpha-mannosidase (GH57 family)